MPIHRPLSGRTVVVTRPRAQAGPLLRLLARRGARVVAAPMLVFAPGDRKGLARAARDLARGAFDWVFFTSANGVAASAAIRQALRRGRSTARVAAVGPATAAGLRKAGCWADLVPRVPTGEALAAAWRRRAGGKARGARVLLLQPDIAPDDLAERLRRIGASVRRVTAYRTRGPSRLDGRLARLLRAGRIDWVVFASPSAAVHLARLLGRAGLPIRGFRTAVIGPTTARAARQQGFRVATRSPDQSETGLVRALEKKSAAPIRTRR